MLHCHTTVIPHLAYTPRVVRLSWGWGRVVQWPRGPYVVRILRTLPFHTRHTLHVYPGLSLCTLPPKKPNTWLPTRRTRVSYADEHPRRSPN